jgi:hypothetical protein
VGGDPTVVTTVVDGGLRVHGHVTVPGGVVPAQEVVDGAGLRVHGHFLAYVARAGADVVLHTVDLAAGGDVPRVTIRGRLLGLDVTDDGIYWIEAGAVSDGQGLYPLVSGSSLNRRLWAGTNTETLATGFEAAAESGLRVAGEQVFWMSADPVTREPIVATWSPGAAWMSRLAFTAAPEIYSTTSRGRIAVDDGFVYIVDPAGTGIARVPRGGGAPTTLAAATGVTSPLVVDDGFVYWVDTVARGVAKAGGHAFALQGTTDAPCLWPVADGRQVFCARAGDPTTGAFPPAAAPFVTAIPPWWKGCDDAALAQHARACDGQLNPGGPLAGACATAASTHTPALTAAFMGDYQSDGTSLFVLGDGGGTSTLFQQRLDGGPTTAVVPDVFELATDLRIHGGLAAFVTSSSNPNSNHVIEVLDLSSKARVASINAGGAVDGLALADDGIYWIAVGQLQRRLWSSATTEIVLAGLSTPPSPVVPGLSTPTSPIDSSGSALTLAGDQLFWLSSSSTIETYSLGSGAVGSTSLAQATVRDLGELNGARQLVVDDGFVYFVADQRIARAARHGGATEPLADVGTDVAGNLAADAGFVYWLTPDASGATLTALRKSDRRTFTLLSIVPSDCRTLIADGHHLLCMTRPAAFTDNKLTILTTWWTGCSSGAFDAQSATCGTTVGP